MNVCPKYDLQHPAQAAAYIESVVELNDRAALLLALRHIVDAHGMSKVARRAALGEKTLFQALSERGNPTLTTLTKLLSGIGLKLRIESA
jgi:probable addiction module antidote protein